MNSNFLKKIYEYKDKKPELRTFNKDLNGLNQEIES